MSQHPPIRARGAEPSPSGDRARATPAAGVSFLPPDIGPEDAVEEVLALLAKDQYRTARGLARAAARRFPDNPRVQKIADVFDPHDKATARRGGPRQPDRAKDFEWLRHPPKWAQGKWVALVGGDVIAADESFDEVDRILRTKKLSTRPLVHRID